MGYVGLLVEFGGDDVADVELVGVGADETFAAEAGAGTLGADVTAYVLVLVLVEFCLVNV